MDFDQWRWGWEEEIILPNDIGEGLQRRTFRDGGGAGDGDLLPQNAKWNLEPSSTGRRSAGKENQAQEEDDAEPEIVCEPPANG